MSLDNFNVSKEQIATELNSQTFWIGENADIEVEVILYEHNGTNKLTSWLNRCEELNTIEYEGNIEDSDAVLAAMEKLVHDNEEYILDVASWGED